MIQRSLIVVCLFVFSVLSVSTQEDVSLGITDAVPLFISDHPVTNFSESGVYYTIGGQNLATQVIDFETDEVVANLGFLDTNDIGAFFRPPLFYGDDRIMTRNSSNQNLSPKLYNLPEGDELSRLIVFSGSWNWLTVGEDFWYYDRSNPDIARTRLFYQTVGGDAVLVSGQLGHASSRTSGFSYFGGALTAPDASTIYVGTLNGVLEWDVATQTRTRTLPFPSATNLAITPDGRLLSTTTNSGSNWRVIDLESGEEVYSNQSQGRSVGRVRADGAYAASSQGLSDAGNGNLSVVDLATGEELLRVEGVYTGDIRGEFGNITGSRTSYNWLGDNLFFLREVDGESGLITIFNPETGELTETDRVGLPYGIAPYKLPWFNITPGGQHIEISLSLNELGFFNAEGELVRTLPLTERVLRPVLSTRTFAVGNIVFGIPSDARPALTTVTGTTNVDNINVRSFPSADGTRVNGATGPVEAIARNNAGTWVLLSSHAGWVSADALTLDGDVQDLIVYTPR